MIWLNGSIIRDDDPKIAVLDAANPDAWGVFETLRTYERSIFKLKEHLDRLEASAKALNFDLPVSKEEVARQMQAALAETAADPVRIKVLVNAEDVFIQMVPLQIDVSIYEGVKAVTAKLTREKPAAKALPYRGNFLAHLSAQNQGAYEAILVDQEGFVSEGAYSNIFWVKGGKLFTRDEGVLQGITRQVILDHFPVEFSKVTVEELLNCDEVFLTKTTTGPVPIVAIDEHIIGEGKAGPLTQKVMAVFEGLTH